MINAPEVTTTREQQLSNDENSHVFIYNKTESIGGLYQHDYHELTLVLTRRYFQEVNGKRMLLEQGDFVFIPLGSRRQSFYKFDAMHMLSVGTSKRFFGQHYLSLLSYCFVTSQVYRTNSAFLTYVETVISSLNFRETGLEEFVEMVIFYVINRLRHYREEQVIDDIPQRLKSTVEKMHDKEQSSESVLESMVTLSVKSQEYLMRMTQQYYGKTPMQIINEIHINFAKKQLEMTNYSVTDTTFKAGYSSPSLFTRTFKRSTSFTPKSYRKKLTGFNQ